MSYYKQIDGAQYDRELIAAAEEAVAGKGDGRISRSDAERLLTFLIDGGKITAVEQATLVYIREHFTWTDKADAWLRDAIAKWEAERSGSTPAPAPAPAASGEPAVVARIQPGSSLAAHLSDEVIAQSTGTAVLILANYPGSTQSSAVWEHTEPHKTGDLSDEVETALVQAGTAMVHSNLWRISSAIGTHNGRVAWQSGFTNVSADVLVGALRALGMEVFDADDLIG